MQEQPHTYETSQSIQLKVIPKDTQVEDQSSAHPQDIKVDIEKTDSTQEVHPPESDIKRPIRKGNNDKNSGLKGNCLTSYKTFTKNCACIKTCLTWLIFFILLCTCIGIFAYLYLNGHRRLSDKQASIERNENDYGRKNFELKAHLIANDTVDTAIVERKESNHGRRKFKFRGPSKANGTVPAVILERKESNDDRAKFVLRGPSIANDTVSLLHTVIDDDSNEFALNVPLISNDTVSLLDAPAVERKESNDGRTKFVLRGPSIANDTVSLLHTAIDDDRNEFALNVPLVSNDTVSLLNAPAVERKENNDSRKKFVIRGPSIANDTVPTASMVGAATLFMPMIFEEPDRRNANSHRNEIFEDILEPTDTTYMWEDNRHDHNKGRPKSKIESLHHLRFTSGHQNNFGVPIEEDARILGLLNAELLQLERKTEAPKVAIRTEDSAIVSPTIPTPLNNLVDSSTNKMDEEVQCQSVSMNICRGVLQYDLTSSSQNQHLSPDDLIDIEHLISSNCSQRAAEFICSLFEPECRPHQVGPLQPCKRICKSILEVCSSLILDSDILTFSFDCDKYPDSDNRSECEDPTRRTACHTDEFRCNDMSCIPNDWRCDNIKDCNEGEDEADCLECDFDEFRCRSNEKCIPNGKRCDKIENCADGSDEEDCSTELDHTGAHLYFGPHSFLNILFKNYTKDRTFFATSEEDRMTSESRLEESVGVVDSDYQHPNGSMEVGGLKNQTIDNFHDREVRFTENDSRPTQTMAVPSCVGDELRCVSGKCITVDQLCDKIMDCPEGEDELMCTYKEQFTDKPKSKLIEM